MHTKFVVPHHLGPDKHCGNTFHTPGTVSRVIQFRHHSIGWNMSHMMCCQLLYCVFPLTITCGGSDPPAAFIAPIIVIVSRLPLVLLWRYFVPRSVTTRPGLWSSWTPVSSMFQMHSGFRWRFCVHHILQAHEAFLHLFRFHTLMPDGSSAFGLTQG
jgi:hypothetical protein